MPSSPNYKRDYKQERVTELARDGLENNAARKQARRDMEKKGLVRPFDGKDVDHKVPLSKGGSTRPGNLRVKDAADNRSYPRKKDGSIK